MTKILIAEDERDIQELLQLTLRHAGHEVVVADDGLAAHRLAVQERPDLILMDVRMPKMNGYEACRRIKAEPGLEHVPVVFLSVRGADSEVKAGYEAGADEYLVKPFSPKELNERVAALLSRGRNQSAADQTG